MSSLSLLRADVYVAPPLPAAILRNGERSAWSPISCTLIHGRNEAVLVDTPISIAQTEDLIQWIESIMPTKRLSYIYITHGHGDHFFGISTLLKRWPEARAIATPTTITHMHAQLEPAWFDNLWLKFFPGGQIAQPVIFAEPMTGDTFEIEGHVFRAIEVGHTDTEGTTVLHVPDIKLVVAGDVVYGDVHQYFREANTTAKRAEWLRAIDIIEALKPQTVVAGHKRPGSIDGLYNLWATREYILAFEEGVKICKNPAELAQRMWDLYPDRLNPHAVLMGAAAAFNTKLAGLENS